MAYPQGSCYGEKKLLNEFYRNQIFPQKVMENWRKL